MPSSVCRRALAAVAIIVTAFHARTATAGDDFYGFSRLLKGEIESNKNTNIKPTRFDADAKGGVIRVRMPDTAGKCSAEYEFTWKFIDDISKLKFGKKYRFHVSGKRISGNCEKNTNILYMKSAMSGSKLATAAGIKTPGRSIELQPRIPNINGYPPSENNSSDGTIVIASSNVLDHSYFTFDFHFASFPYSGTSKKCVFQVTYVFGKNLVAAAPTSGATNCPALYGLGVNIGVLEYGSLENAKTTFLAGFIDHAITNMKASGCIADSEVAYLEDLKKRMLEVERSRSFAQEISTYRQELAQKIVATCACE